MAARERPPERDLAERLFLDLVRPGKPRCWDGVTGERLVAVAALAFGHGLFLLVDHRIREQAALHGAAGVIAQYDQSVRQLREHHISHALQYERAAVEVRGLLERAGVATVTLKGAALSQEVHGDPCRRTSADIDLLVRPADVAAADAALGAAGYRRDNDRALAFWMRRLHHAAYHHRQRWLPVEIHWGFSIPGFFNLEPAGIWAGVALDGLHGRLEPDLVLTHLLMHHHLHGCSDLRTLVDLVWALERHGTPPPAGPLADRFAAAGLLVAAGIAREQARRLWGLQLWEFGRRRRHHGWRVHLLAAATLPALRPGRRPRRSDRFLHAVVHRLGLDSPRRVLAAIAKSAFPAAADLRALSPGGRSGPAAYVRYFRWRFGGMARDKGAER